MTRVVPLPAMYIAPLRWQRLRQATQRRQARAEWVESDQVFTTRTGRPIEPRNVTRSFQRITEDESLPPIRLHDTRHGCATLLIAAGVPMRVVMEILGHSQIAVTGRPHVAHGPPAEEAPPPALMSNADVRSPGARSLRGFCVSFWLVSEGAPCRVRTDDPRFYKTKRDHDGT